MTPHANTALAASCAQGCWIINCRLHPWPVQSPNIRLFFPECGTCRLLAVTGTTALDVHVIRMTFIIGIINALYRFIVNADGLAGMDHGAFEGILSLPPASKAVTAGIVTVTCMLSSHHNIALAAHGLLIIGTIFSRTF